MEIKGKAQQAGRRLAQSIAELFAIDLRALAVFRIGVGLFVIIDLAVRLSDLSIFYSDDGVLPRDALLERSSPWMLSLYNVFGAPAFQAILFGVAMAAAAAMLLGYRTRTATILTWLFVLSIQNRNPFVNQNGDLLLRLILFWGIFLPLGARWSLDRLQGRARPPSSTTVLSLASVALLMQPVFMYVFAAQLKTGVDWRNGSAVYYALQYKLLATSRAPLLIPHTALLSLVTHSVVMMERFGPLLLFIPVIGAPIRTLAAFGFMSFHLGMSTFLDLGPFMWVPELALIPFLPTWFWDRAERGTVRVVARVPLRRESLAVLRMNLLLPVFALTSLPSRGLSDDSRQISHLDDAGSLPSHSDGGMESPVADHGVTGESGAPARAGNTRPWHRLRSAVFGSILPGLLLLYVLLLNLHTVTGGNYVVLPHLAWLGDSLGLDQRWSMFAPRPPHDSGWFVVPGVERNGRRLDFWRGPKPVSWQEPRSVLELYPNERWRKYAESLAWSSENDVEYARYLCRSWNANHTGPNALMRFKMYFMRIDTPSPSHPLQHVKPKRVQLATWYCFGKPK